MSASLTPGVWTLDPAHSGVEFTVKHLGISTVRGRFGTVSAELNVGDSPRDSSLTAEIDMSSVDTGNADRDGHLRSTDFFDVETQPKMTFASTEIAETGDGTFRVTGQMTINGHTQEETLDVSFGGTETFPMDGSQRAGFEATGTIDRTAYGVSFNVPLESGASMLAEKVAITLDAQLIAPGD